MERRFRQVRGVMQRAARSGAGIPPAAPIDQPRSIASCALRSRVRVHYAARPAAIPTAPDRPAYDEQKFRPLKHGGLAHFADNVEHFAAPNIAAGDLTVRGL